MISPEDYYFFHIAKLEDVTGKFIPKGKEKTFSNVLIVNGMLYDKNGGKLEIIC